MAHSKRKPKAPAIVGLMEEIGDDRGMKRCATCKNAGWVRVVDEWLEGREAGTISPVSTSRTLWRAMQTRYDELQIDRYDKTWASLNRHLLGCRTEAWAKTTTHPRQGD